MIYNMNIICVSTIRWCYFPAAECPRVLIHDSWGGAVHANGPAYVRVVVAPRQRRDHATSATLATRAGIPKLTTLPLMSGTSCCRADDVCVLPMWRTGCFNHVRLPRDRRGATLADTRRKKKVIITPQRRFDVNNGVIITSCVRSDADRRGVYIGGLMTTVGHPPRPRVITIHYRFLLYK